MMLTYKQPLRVPLMELMEVLVQKCTASSRLIVHEKIYKEFVEGLIENIKNIKVGHA